MYILILFMTDVYIEYGGTATPLIEGYMSGKQAIRLNDDVTSKISTVNYHH